MSQPTASRSNPAQPARSGRRPPWFRRLPRRGNDRPDDVRTYRHPRSLDQRPPHGRGPSSRKAPSPLTRAKRRYGEVLGKHDLDLVGVTLARECRVGCDERKLVALDRVSELFVGAAEDDFHMQFDFEPLQGCWFQATALCFCSVSSSLANIAAAE